MSGWQEVARAAEERHAADEQAWVHELVGQVGRARRRRLSAGVGLVAVVGVVVAGVSLGPRPPWPVTTAVPATTAVPRLVDGWELAGADVPVGVDVHVSVSWRDVTVIGSCPAVVLPIGHVPGPQELPLWVGSGSAWRQATPATLDAPATCVSSLVATDAGLLATVDGAVLRSDDGVTWEAVALPGLAGSPVVVSVRGTTVVVSGQTAAADVAARRGLWSSTDTRTWRAEPGTADLPSAGVRTSLGNRDVVVGSTGGGVAPERPLAWYSDDGLTWVRAEVSADDGCAMTDVVTWSGGLVAAGSCGSDVGLWTSVDGAVWRRADSPQPAVTHARTLAPRAAIAVAGDRLVVAMADAGVGADVDVPGERRQWLGTPGGAWVRADDLVAPFHAAAGVAFWPAEPASAPGGALTPLRRLGG